MACVTWCDYAGDPRPDKTPDTNLLTWEVEVSTFSNWLRDKVLKHNFIAGQTFVPTFPLYAGLCSTVSDSQNPGTELNGGGYARVAVAFESVSDIKLWNAAQYSHPLATSTWTVASLVLFDQQIGGNYYAYGNLIAPITVESGKTVTYKASGSDRGIVIGLGSLLP